MFSHVTITFAIIPDIPDAAFVVVARRGEDGARGWFKRDVVDEGGVFTYGNHGNLHLVVECKQTNVVVETNRRKDQLEGM